MTLVKVILKVSHKLEGNLTLEKVAMKQKVSNNL